MAAVAALVMLFGGAPAVGQEVAPDEGGGVAADEPEESPAPASPAPPPAALIECRVLYVTATGLYVDAGSAAGLEEGQSGVVQQGGAPLGGFEVSKLAPDSSFLVVTGGGGMGGLVAGARVTLVLDGVLEPGAAPAAGSPTGPRAPSATLKAPGDGGFVPLLEAPDLGDRAFTEAENVFQGRITARQVLQSTDRGDLDYARTEARTSGSLERIARTPWALEWSAAASYRQGDGLASVRNHEDIRLEVFRLSLYRRFDDRGLLRLGRFLPRELPAIGFLDGIHGEAAVNDHLRVGAMAGFKPKRDSLALSTSEPLAAAYAALDLGAGAVRFNGTAGILASLYDGDPDRLAVLVDARLDLGPVAVFSTSELDLDVGASDQRHGPRLTRWNLLASWALNPTLTLRAGLDRFEIPDTAAERDLVNPDGLTIPELFEEAYWRSFVGATLHLPGALRLAGDVAFVDATVAGDEVRWSAALTRQGLPLMPWGSATLAVYNLQASHTDGYGVRLSAYLPLLSRRLILQPAVGFRVAEHETTGARFFDDATEDAAVLEASFRAHWAISSAWAVAGGVSYADTDDDGRLLVDLSVTWKW